MSKLYKSFVFDLVMAILCLALGIIMLPPFGIGEQILRILVALLLVAYLILFLFDKIKAARGSVFVLGVIEFIIVSLMVVDLLLEQFTAFHLSGVCHTVGIVLALRGVILALTLYLGAYYTKRKQKNIFYFATSLVFIGGGVFLFAKPVLSDLVINWAACCVLFLCFIIYGGLSLLFSPERKK